MSQYNYSNKEPPTCKYCSTDKNKTLIRFKKNELGKWVVFNMDGSEHSRQYCDEMKRRNQSQQSQQQQQQVSVFPQQQQLPPVQQQTRGEEVAPNGITPYSSYILASDTRKEVREVKKQVQTLTDIVDSMAQKIELILKQTGYPKPEPVIEEEDKGASYKEFLEEEKALREKERQGQEEDDVRANPGFAEFLDNKNQKALEEANNNIAEKMNNETKKEDEHLIVNPYRLPKMEEEEEPTPTQTTNDGGWRPISQKFECHSCGGPKFNGYEKYNTLICLDCKESIDEQGL